MNKRTSTLLAVALAAALLTGCATDQTSPTRPAFAGKFAAEYHEAWEKSRSADVRVILGDEQITDQEWSQVLTRLETCLEERGISLGVYNTDGSYEVNVGGMDGEVANQRMGECEQDSGEAWIGHLYRSQTSNPQNIPATRLVTECLVRNGAAPPSYTEEQYLDDAPGLTFPFTDDHGFEIFESCSADLSFVR